jgi:hypothetical protein
MPSRILREGILSSERVASLGWPEEVFYRRLHSVVDDFGRYFAKPSLLRAACYPLQVDLVGNLDVAKWLTECVRAGLVRAYTVDGKEYLEVLDFRQQVRAKTSKFPEPPADDKHVRSTRQASAHLVVDVVGVGVGDGIEVGVTPFAPSASPLDAGAAPVNGHDLSVVERIPIIGGQEWPVLKPFVEELDRLYPAVEPVQTLREIRGWCIGNPTKRKTKRGVRAFIVSWFAREQDKQSRRVA